MPSLEVATERIKNGLCPICGEPIKGNCMMVVDQNLGNIFICKSHMGGEKTDDMQ